MPWTTLPTYTDGTVLTGAMLNAIKDNINESATAKVLAAGQIIVSTGPNALAARSPSRATNAGSGTTSSIASYGDLAGTGIGPERSLSTGTGAIVFLTAAISNSVAGGSGMMSVSVAGVSTISASDDRGLRVISANANAVQRMTVVHHQIALTAGTNEFTARYTTHSGGTATFQLREIGIIPL